MIEPAAAAAPLALRELLDSVRTHYPAVEAARARVRAARGARTSAGALANPVLAYGVENAPLPGRVAPPMEREAMATVTLPLEAVYQRGPRVRRAAAEVRAAEADAAAAAQQAMLDAAHVYYRAALAQIGLEAARDLAAWLDTVVAYNRTRVNEGVAAEADLLRSELERDRAAAEATMQEADLARARADLASYFANVDPDTPVEAMIPSVVVDDAPLTLPYTPGLAGTPAPADSAAVREAGAPVPGRPQVRAARERLAGASAAVTVERRLLLREIGAVVGTKRSAGTTSLVAGLSLPVPLFDQNRGETRRALAERDAAAFELAGVERNARAELAGAAEAARLLTARATALSTRGPDGIPVYLARADEARRITLGAYREGAIPLLNVIDAARTWGEARMAYYQTLFAQHESTLMLLAAQGIDLAAALPTPTPGGNR
ncbi:MAG TPA: TolC family protein [Longimicrobiales bacterium]|nr:TolC family protein [Longimicrobiales bacterium]